MSGFIDLYLSPKFQIFLQRHPLDDLVRFDHEVEGKIKTLLSVDTTKAQALLCLYLLEKLLARLEKTKEDNLIFDSDCITAIFMSTYVDEIERYLRAKYPTHPLNVEGGVVTLGISLDK